jgi:hypothetical protein
MGWQFVVAEIFGALMLIVLMWLLVTLFFPQELQSEIRIRAQKKVQGSIHCHHEPPTSQGFRRGGRLGVRHGESVRWRI